MDMRARVAEFSRAKRDLKRLGDRLSDLFGFDTAAVLVGRHVNSVQDCYYIYESVYAKDVSHLFIHSKPNSIVHLVLSIEVHLQAREYCRAFVCIGDVRNRI